MTDSQTTVPGDVYTIIPLKANQPNLSSEQIADFDSTPISSTVGSCVPKDLLALLLSAPVYYNGIIMIAD